MLCTQTKHLNKAELSQNRIWYHYTSRNIHLKPSTMMTMTGTLRPHSSNKYILKTSVWNSFIYKYVLNTNTDSKKQPAIYAHFVKLTK